MKNKSIYRLVYIAAMAAIICVVTFFRFPLLGSKVHLGNTCCLLAGLLFGGVGGGLAAGIGSMLNDLVSGYGIDECLVTFVSKFAMAFICAAIARSGRGGKARAVAGSVIGALSYVALYMCKTFVYRRFVYGYPMDAVWATMLSKLPASAINAVFAMVVAPILFAAVRPPLEKAGFLEKIK